MQILPLDEEAQEILEEMAKGDDLVLVRGAQQQIAQVYTSVDELVREYLGTRAQMGVCAPLYNVLLDQLDDLESIAQGTRPEGRPLSPPRHMARRLLERGLGYESTLWLLKTVSQQPKVMEYSADYSFGKGAGKLKLTLSDASRLRNAVDREWKLQHDDLPPSPPGLWWKDDTWTPQYGPNVAKPQI